MIMFFVLLHSFGVGSQESHTCSSVFIFGGPKFVWHIIHFTILVLLRCLAQGIGNYGHEIACREREVNLC